MNQSGLAFANREIVKIRSDSRASKKNILVLDILQNYVRQSGPTEKELNMGKGMTNGRLIF